MKKHVEAKVGFVIQNIILITFFLIIFDLKPNLEEVSFIKKSKKPLKILMILHSFPTTVQTFVINQIPYLIDHGHQVDIFAKLRRENAASGQLDIITKYDLLNHCFFKKFTSSIKSYDVIIFQFETMALDYIDIVKRINKRALIVTFVRAGGFLKANDKRLHTLFKKCDLFIPVCDFLAKNLINLGCNPKKIEVIYGGIDSSKFSYFEKTKKNTNIVITTTCRLVPEKGILNVLEAIANLLPEHPNLHYVIMGEGPHRDKIVNQIKKLKLQKNVTLMGFTTHNKVAQILETSDIFVLACITLPSGRVEGIPNALKEAMARGLPVISTVHSGIPELVENGISGFLIPENDVKLLTKKIKELIMNSNLRLQMGAAGRKKILSEFELNTQNKRFLDLLCKRIKKPRNL